LIEDKKLGGILTESVFSGSTLQGSIIGIGINVNQKLRDFPEELQTTAATLRDTLNSEYDVSKEDLVVELLYNLEKYYDMLLAGDVDEVLDNWKKHTTTIGRKVAIKLENGEEIEGKAEDLDGTGALVLRKSDGNTRVIIVGDCIHLEEE
jgi:BirA family biotin operon repressor/biotin-[acetyl-CoA-carboxylase] ligase